MALQNNKFIRRNNASLLKKYYDPHPHSCNYYARIATSVEIAKGYTTHYHIKPCEIMVAAFYRFDGTGRQLAVLNVDVIHDRGCCICRQLTLSVYMHIGLLQCGKEWRQ